MDNRIRIETNKINVVALICYKRVVNFSATLVYNLIRKAIGCDSDSPSVKFKHLKEIASKLSQGSF